MKEYEELATKYKKEMIDLDADGFNPGRYLFDIFQLKYDGWWTFVKIENGKGIFITSGGDVRHTFSCTGVSDCEFIGEWIYGTNWAETSGLKGALFAHQLISYRGEIYEDQPYSYSQNMLGWVINSLSSNGYTNFHIAKTYTIDQWEEVWSKFILEIGYEGLVFKKSDASFSWSKLGRMKQKCTMDYVVMGFEEGNKRLSGTLGAIVGGLFVNGVLTKICTVGGGFKDFERDEIWENKDKYIGKVFEARGKIKFSSGALRHPAFTVWRPDKLPGMCKL